MRPMCSVRVTHSHWGTHACPNPSKVARDGKLYCGVHDPARQEARDAEAREREHARVVAHNAAANLRYAKIAAFERVLAVVGPTDSKHYALANFANIGAEVMEIVRAFRAQHPEAK